MSHQLVHLLVSGVSVLLVAFVLPGMKVKSFGAAVGFALVAGILQFVCWEVLWPVTLPLTIVTLYVAKFVLNGVLFLLARKVVPGIEISGCLVASIAAVAVTLVDGVLVGIVDRVVR